MTRCRVGSSVRRSRWRGTPRSGIGGSAELMAFPTEPAQLQALLRLAHEAGVAPHILGRGDERARARRRLRGLTICLRDCLIGLELLDGTHISAMAGVSLAKTALFAAADGLSGMETLHGIPARSAARSL